MIPKIVHKTGHYESEKAFPASLKETFEKNKKMNPDYEFRYYNDTDSEKIILYQFGPGGLNAYKNVIPGAFRADIFRFCVIYLFGGIYSDLAQEFLVPLNEFIDHENDDLILSQCFFYPLIEVNFFAAKPNHSYIYDVLQQQMQNIKSRKYPLYLLKDSPVLGITGPRVAYDVFKRYKKKDINFENHIRLVPNSKKLIKSFMNFSKQKLMFNKKDVISYYSDKIKKKTRSSNKYGKLYSNGKVYKDYKPFVSPLAYTILLFIEIILVILLIIFIIFLFQRHALLALYMLFFIIILISLSCFTYDCCIN